MDTTNKHIGNILYNMTDEDIKEVFEQFSHKLGFDKFENGRNWELNIIRYINDILLCNHFDYKGDCILDEEDHIGDEVKIESIREIEI